MNDLNDPQDWNLRPERQRDGGDGWNYSLLLPMLGLAAYRWIWSKHSQKEIENAKVKMQKALDLDRQKLLQEQQNIKIERDALKYETTRLFHKSLEKEKEEEQRALNALDAVEKMLLKRQRVYCSNFVYHPLRLEMENDLLATTKKPNLAHLKMEDDLKDIFKNDRSCAEYFNTDERKNGSLMWLYLRYWKLKLALQSHQRAEAAILGKPTTK